MLHKNALENGIILKIKNQWYREMNGLPFILNFIGTVVNVSNWSQKDGIVYIIHAKVDS